LALYIMGQSVFLSRRYYFCFQNALGYLWRCKLSFFFFKAITLHIPWRDSISRPIAPLWQAETIPLDPAVRAWRCELSQCRRFKYPTIVGWAPELGDCWLPEHQDHQRHLEQPFHSTTNGRRESAEKCVVPTCPRER
jgi:hypothetical protein